MTDFVKVANKKDLPSGRMMKVTANGTDVLLLNWAGKVHAYEHECPHAHAALSEGELDNGTLTCYLHGSQYDANTGAMKRGPTKRGLIKYEVKVSGEDILVKI